ncbi:MAG: AzlD protein [Bacillales bacterium]|jgi:branched-subunit amino acid transport protein|nr:AzlD protein [Bacillales bacterium]
MEIILIIVGMAIVTLIPRVYPILIFDKITLSSGMRKWLKAVPYAALGALIFPGILTVVPDKPYIGIIGAAVAGVLSYYKQNIIVVILFAIISVFIANNYF